MHSLGITHVLSTSRVKPVKFRGIVYILVNKASFSNSTLKLTTNFITEAVNKGNTLTKTESIFMSLNMILDLIKLKLKERC